MILPSATAPMRPPCAWRVLLLPAIEVQESPQELPPGLPRVAAGLETAVREAGLLARSMFQKPLKNWTKGPGNSPVSEADIAVNEFLQQRLTAIDRDFAWLSEESVDDSARLCARHVRIFAPLYGHR